MGVITGVCLLLMILGAVLNFQQNEFKVVFERVEVVDYNTTLFSSGKSHNFKYNRTTALVNMTFEVLHDFVGKLDTELQAYRFASNEYRYFPLRFSFDFCDFSSKNEGGIGQLYRCGNLTGCPFKKGIHHICNWAPNGTKFPPHIPSGSYMLDLKLIYRGVESLFMQLYAQVKYPEVKGFGFF